MSEDAHNSGLTPEEMIQYDKALMELLLRRNGVLCTGWQTPYDIKAEDCVMLWSMGIRADDDLL